VWLSSQIRLLLCCPQIVAVAPALEAAGEVTRVTAYTSDLIELVSGVCPVRCPSLLSTPPTLE
jgi:hypothetical protein